MGALLLTLVASASAAQADEGPIVLGRQERGPFLTLDPIHGNVGFNTLFQYEHSNVSGSSTDATSTLLQETLTLNTAGGIVSRNLIDWYASGTVGLEEEWSHSPERNESTIGILYAYDLNATILRTTDLPISLYARRGESFVNRSFAPMLKNEVTTFGGSATLRSSVFPSSVRIYRTSTTQTDLSDNVQYQLDENHAEFQTSWQPTDRQELNIEYQYTGVDQNNPSIQNNTYALQNVTASHHWAFDAASHYTLSSFLNYSDQSGDFPFSQLRLTEQLQMQHTDYFQTNLNYDYNRQEYSNTLSNTHTFPAGFTHRLFQSLSTTGQAGYSLTDNSAGSGFEATSTSSNAFANLGVNYTKMILMGRFTANAGVAYSQTDNGPVGQAPVVNDIHQFPDLEPIVLTRPGIIASSIQVFDRNNVLRKEGVDYLVHVVGETVQIEPIIGRFDPNEAVRLNYDILPLPGYTATTSSFNLGSRYEFTEGPLTGLAFFGQYFQQNQDISSSAPNLLVADDIRDLLMGGEYRVWKLIFRAESENRESTLAPFQAVRFSARYADRLSDRTTLSLTGIQSFIHYPQQGSDTNVTTVDGHLQYEISRDLRSIITARFRNTDDSRFGQTMAFEEQAELRWKIRQSDLFFLIRHTALDSHHSDTNSFFFQFGLTRYF